MVKVQEFMEQKGNLRTDLEHQRARTHHYYSLLYFVAVGEVCRLLL